MKKFTFEILGWGFPVMISSVLSHTPASPLSNGTVCCHVYISLICSFFTSPLESVSKMNAWMFSRILSWRRSTSTLSIVSLTIWPPLSWTRSRRSASRMMSSLPPSLRMTAAMPSLILSMRRFLVRASVTRSYFSSGTILWPALY